MLKVNRNVCCARYSVNIRGLLYISKGDSGGFQFIRIGRRMISKLNNLLKGDFDKERKMSEPEVQDSAWESEDDNNTRKIAGREAARISAVSRQDDLW